jgi:CcmD family protein
MEVMASLLGVAIAFWSAIFLYIVWIDRKITSMKKRLALWEQKD